jgi:hypothetical protein
MWTGGPARVESTPIRGRFRAISTPNLAIINIRLEGLPDGGDPAFLTSQFLRAYYPPRSPTVLEYFHVRFNIDPDKAASQRSHERKMSEIKNKLQKYMSFTPFSFMSADACSRAHIEHVLVFVFTHSDPENGFLHCQADFKSEISVSEVRSTTIQSCTQLRVSFSPLLLASPSRSISADVRQTFSFSRALASSTTTSLLHTCVILLVGE